MMDSLSEARLLICRDCADGAGAALAASVDGAVDGVRVQLTDCMNVCDRPVTCAFRAADRDTYLFGDLTVDDHADLIALMQLYRAADPGIKDARPAARLRHCLIGRIPL